MKIFALLLFLLTIPALAASQFKDLVVKAQDLEHEGKRPEAIRLYEKAWKLTDKKIDKLPVLIELVKLHRNDRIAGERWLREVENWAKERPELKEKISPWVVTMRNHFAGTPDPATTPPMFESWASWEKVSLLMEKKDFASAWEIVKAMDLEEADHRSKIIHDVLSAVVTKINPQNFLCEESLRRYPSSYAWTIRTCRFLKNTKDSSLKRSIIEQIRKEEPHSSYVARALEEL